MHAVHQVAAVAFSSNLSFVLFLFWIVVHCQICCLVFGLSIFLAAVFPPLFAFFFGFIDFPFITAARLYLLPPIPGFRYADFRS
jgi:hypothetical protein